MRKFAISDIHGCNTTFQALLDKIALSTSDELYLLGDYVDRGPDSKEVIDHILHLQKKGYTVHCLWGNHEQMMQKALAEDATETDMYHWLLNGGLATMNSFTAAYPEGDIPDQYQLFLNQLHDYLEVDNYILVHAGLNFRHADPLTDRESMLWIRQWYDNIRYDWLQGRSIVHGHTPVGKPHIEAQDFGSAINIDAGCVYKGAERGYLCALDMTNQKFYWQPNVENA
ncbi:MAG TPA: metallophosphoesterase family protein [Saprospiraceae bacterium]|nr:metallophosphoesterase family protein [Saprospiraceae bacterium]HMP23460.1 metallophosphoesterase family protein [Saprospiraceae bacterium]